MSETDELLRKARNKVEDYTQTVKALLAFSAFVVHDGHEQRAGAAFGFGRRMTTSDENKVTPSNSVTPDLVAQKSSDYGITAEVKKSLPADQTLWDKPVRQLLRYDDDLEGWWTENQKIPCADVVMLIHQSRGRSFARFLQATKEENPEAVGDHTSVVEFNSSAETSSYYFFRLEHGAVRDAELLHKLDNGVEVPLDKVLASFPNVKYYDSPPPVAYLLKELWMDLFVARLGDAEYNEKYKATVFEASVREITEELQRAYGSATLLQDQRAVQFPAHKWVKDAFEKLVEFKLALPPSDGNDKYQILFKNFRGDILDRFIELELRSQDDNDQGAEDHPSQLPLFEDDEAEE